MGEERKGFQLGMLFKKDGPELPTVSLLLSGFIGGGAELM